MSDGIDNSSLPSMNLLSHKHPHHKKHSLTPYDKNSLSLLMPLLYTLECPSPPHAFTENIGYNTQLYPFLSTKSMAYRKKYSIKQILVDHQNWWQFYEKHKKTLRDSIVLTIVKLLSCKNLVRGYQVYQCSNPNCSHTKRFPFTCKSKACSSCGKKATDIWIQKQHQILPNTTWQHITFTMPAQLWDFFWYNRSLLNLIAKIAAECIQSIARKKKLIPGIFIAIHTFGRDLKRNVHIHVSTTTGGISEDQRHWKNLFFDQKTLMRMWRYRIIQLFRRTEQRQALIIPSKLQKQFNHTFTFSQFLDQLYKKTWIVHCSKPSNDHQQNVNYLGRYIKRPPIAESKLKHYDGAEVTFNYLDHTTKTYRRLSMSSEEFIGRFVQHIPDIGFRMIRYYGFLAHRVRGKMLPIVYRLLQQDNIQTTASPTYAELMQKNFSFNPFTCILCGQQLVLSYMYFGLSSAKSLLPFHRPLALLQKI